MGRQFFRQRKFDTVALHSFNTGKANAMAVTQFVKLAGLGTQHAHEMMRRFAIHDGTVPRKLFNEKASPHAEILTQEGGD